MAQLFETVCMSLVFNKSHSLAMHYCRLVWDVRSLSTIKQNVDAAHLLWRKLYHFDSIIH